MQMVPPRNKGPHFPSHSAVEFDHHGHSAAGLVLAEGNAVVRRHRDGVAVDERGPDVYVLVALIDWRDGGEVRDLLVVVGGVNVHPIVVDADPRVRVAGADGDLHGGRDDVRGGDIEAEDGGVLEDEPGCFGLQDSQNEEDDDEGGDEEAGQELEGESSPLAPVVVAYFFRHGAGGSDEIR
ncbi:hypothetical protein F511_09576 [Dorcoceras hygrometricum]|uniref:Uncharacterized protein n=1 Tax=Dorcoceras hygrometricum TaxID=472368 RepID=A0A2Z7CPJ5_9LAMI|nr:hypothetical protein F511_09576 [Dorcoceras hygrometricum]